MKKLFIIILLFISVALFADKFLNDFYDSVNNYRQSLGLSALRSDKDVENIAETYSDVIADIGWLDHKAVTGFEFTQLCNSYGVFDDTMGEILATCPDDYRAYQVFLLFKESPLHNTAMLKPNATYMGAGYVTKFDRMFFTAYIVTPKK
jgi:uncharacterized protein YkwD